MTSVERAGSHRPLLVALAGLGLTGNAGLMLWGDDPPEPSVAPVAPVPVPPTELATARPMPWELWLDACESSRPWDEWLDDAGPAYDWPAWLAAARQPQNDAPPTPARVRQAIESVITQAEPQDLTDLRRWGTFGPEGFRVEWIGDRYAGTWDYWSLNELSAEERRRVETLLELWGQRAVRDLWIDRGVEIDEADRLASASRVAVKLSRPEAPVRFKPAADELALAVIDTPSFRKSGWEAALKGVAAKYRLAGGSAYLIDAQGVRAFDPSSPPPDARKPLANDDLSGALDGLEKLRASMEGAKPNLAVVWDTDEYLADLPDARKAHRKPTGLDPVMVYGKLQGQHYKALDKTFASEPLRLQLGDASDRELLAESLAKPFAAARKGVRK